MALAYISAFFHRVCPAVVALDLQEAFGISAGLVGLLASTYFYSYAFIQFPGGLLSDSLGPRATVSLFLVIGAVGSVLFGASPSLELALIGRVLVGFGAGMAFTPTMKILSHWFTVREFTRMTGLLVGLGGLGALTAAMPLALVAGWVGWRLSFEIIGAATFILALLVWLLVRNKPEDMGWAPVSEIDRLSINLVTPEPKIRLWQGVRQVVFTRHFWTVAVWGFLTMGCFFGFGGLWAGPYLMQVYGMTRTEAGEVLNMLAFGIMVGSPLMSFLSERVFMSRKKVLIFTSSVVVLLLICLNLRPIGLPEIALYPILFLFGICCLSPGVIGVTIVKELFPLEITGTSVGTVNLFPFVGGAVMQMAIGWLLDSYPKTQSGSYTLEAYSGMLLFVLVTAVIALICSLLLKETFPREGTRK